MNLFDFIGNHNRWFLPDYNIQATAELHDRSNKLGESHQWIIKFDKDVENLPSPLNIIALQNKGEELVGQTFIGTKHYWVHIRPEVQDSDTIYVIFGFNEGGFVMKPIN